MDDRRVLIVEDDTAVQRVLVRVFERAGFDVAAASNGEKALALISQQHFDVMISDIFMPRMDGRQLCRHLATVGPYLPPYTFIVTSHSEMGERSWVSEFPNIVLVEKPVGPKQLLRLVRQRLATEGADPSPEAESKAS
jgi:two-component system response regulator MprA